MPGGPRDSSKTRVRPVFDQLRARTDDWIRALLGLMHGGADPVPAIPDADYSYVRGAWEPTEERLAPPVALLSWLIRNIDPALARASPDRRRRLLGERDPEAVRDALISLRTQTESSRPWYEFEGSTCPDVFLATPDALIVIEGKRTEREPTTRTKWMSGRHQIWRHIDAAWEIRGSRRVFGCFIVEGGMDGLDAAVPDLWVEAFGNTLSPATLEASFPHRSIAERAEIKNCFLGGGNMDGGVSCVRD